MKRRQELHNEGTQTALITTNRSHYKMDAKQTHTRSGKPARAYNSNTIPRALPAGAGHFETKLSKIGSFYFKSKG